MSRKNAWVDHLPAFDNSNLRPHELNYYKLSKEVKDAWYYKLLPNSVKELIAALETLRVQTKWAYHDERLRYKYAVAQTEIKTLKENAKKALEIKQKYNEFRRERYRQTNEKISKSE